MFEAYSIGIRLSLLGNVGTSLHALSNAFLKTEGRAGGLRKKMEGIERLATRSAGMMAAGMAITASFKPAVDQAIKLEQAMNRLKAMNLGGAQTSALTNKAIEISRNVKGMSQADAVTLVTEAQSITGDSEHTMLLAPGLAKMKFGLETYMKNGGHGEGHGEAAESQFRDVVKVMEMRGLMRNFTADKATQLEDLFTKAFVASGGTVKPSDFLSMMKTAGVAGKQMSPDFMLALGHVMQEMGGSRTGTALMSAYNNWENGRTTDMAAEELARLGLVKKDHIKHTTTGRMKGIKQDALINSELYMSNPLDYLNRVVLPAMAAKGIGNSGDAAKDQKDVLAEISTLFTNRTASALFSQLYIDRGVLSKYMDQTSNVKGVEDLYGQEAQSTLGNYADLQAKLNTLLATIGTTILPPLNRTLDELIPKLQAATVWLQKNPRLLDLLVKGLLGLGMALSAIGTLGMINAALRAFGLLMSFNAVGGAAGFFQIAKGISAFTKALAMTQIMGPSSLAVAAKNFGAMTTAIAVLSQAAAVFAAAYIGWKVGQAASDSLDKSAAEATKGQEQTFGGYLYDRYHPFNEATHKREFSLLGGMWSTDADIVKSNDAESQYMRSGSVNAVMPRQNQGTIQVNSSLYLSRGGMQKIADGVTTHQSNAARGPQTGLSTPDSSQFGMPMGLGYGN